MSSASSSLADLLIKQCTSTTSLRKARQLHALILTSIPITLHTPYTYNNIISMYAKCGSPEDSHNVFDKMPERNIISYSALIAAYSRSPNNAHLAFDLLSQLHATDGFRLYSSTFTGLLQASLCMGDYVLGSALHCQGVKFGFLDDKYVQTSLLSLYLNCKDMECAKKVFYDNKFKDTVAWNTIINGFMKSEKILQGMHYFGNMVRSGARPCKFTYSTMLNACSKLGDYDIGRVVHARVILGGTIADLPLYNALLDMYCTCGDTRTACTVFSRIENPDSVSCNSMIAGYAGNGDGEKVMDMFVRFWQISTEKPDEYTFAAVISATGSFPSTSYGKLLHAQVTKIGLQRSVYVGSTLVSMYFKNGDSASAEGVFNTLLKRDVVLWTDMIAGYSRLAEGENAIRFFTGMLEEGHKPDGFTLSSVLSACADLAAELQGEMIHSQAIKRGYDVEMSVSGSLIDMYAKIGHLKAAEVIISQVKKPDLKCWNSILGGYGNHGKVIEAFKVFDKIIKLGLCPDRVTYLSILGACSHCGLVNEGRYLWSLMLETGLTPGPKHYSCMISLLTRAGLLVEAEQMIIESPYSSENLEMWRTLLSSCVRNRNVEIGIRAAQQILCIDDEDRATNLDLDCQIRLVLGEKENLVTTVTLPYLGRTNLLGQVRPPEITEDNQKSDRNGMVTLKILVAIAVVHLWYCGPLHKEEGN
ncbi:Pentatricopeptide repeat-containing protein [Heracleum sosnowskyi]|uniref:Pentatricopeptide repeat-containing protein n=1 Tax=Heracleum sosnowskyi TaxID=360622 RepID=A0AAD8HAC0_9APIA|nr:Pentatricopeptide repeat-containing protein [Heracleum sosnowskyi]